MTIIPKVALLLPLLAATPAWAQGTEAQRAACGPDAIRLCASSIPDPGRVAACLHRERDRLSGACRAMLDEGSAAARTATAPAPAPAPRPAQAVAQPRDAATPARTARADRESHVSRAAEPRLPRQAASAATPRERAARPERRAPARMAGLERPVRATRRSATPRGDGFDGFSDLEAQAHGWHRTLSGYAGSIERRFARLGSGDFGRLPGL